jgi:hypothetical protein
MSIYYIVVNEWNYETNSGREIIGDYDTREEAEQVAKEEYEKEYDNFLDNTNGEIYRAACGKVVNSKGECIGYELVMSEDETLNIHFTTVIIERDINNSFEIQI